MPVRFRVYLLTVVIAGTLSYRAFPKRTSSPPSGDQQQAESVTAPAASVQELCTQLGAKDVKTACLGRLPAGRKIGSLIATVADPDRTDLSLSFDRAVEALIWAVGDVNYTFQSYWFPWQSGKARGDSESRNANASSAGARAAAGSTDAQSNAGQPGFVLFRGSTPDEFFVVWLVGESPTAGIDTSALNAAIQNVEQYNRKPRTIRIVGPSFSGSFLSLGDVLKSFHDTPAFQVVTGMSTSLDAENTFSRRLPKVAFGATVENSSTAVCGFINYLQRQWRPKDEIAILAEDQTVFGQQVENIPCIASSNLPKEQWLLVRFPRQIARLRNSSEKQDASPVANSTQTSATTGDLPFTLRSPAEAPDNVPIFSREQSPLSQEAVLLEIAYALQHEHVKYAALIATDVLDQIFLARFLHHACPDVRLIVFDSDLLFARAELTSPLEGILNVTTYPLFLRNQHWTSRELRGELPRRVPFASRAAEGVYNAARYELQSAGYVASGELMLDYAPPDNPSLTHPPLWLSVLGKTGYWPVALLNTDDIPVKKGERGEFWVDAAAPTAPPGEKLHPEPPSGAWGIVLGLVSFFSCFNCLYVWFVYLPRLTEQRMHHSRVRAFVSVKLYLMFWIYPQVADRKHQRLFVFLILALSFAEAVFVGAGAPYALPSAGATVGSAAWLFFVPLACWAALVLTALRLSWGARLWSGFLALVWLVWAGFTAIGIHVLNDFRFGDMRAFFLAYRASRPTSGVSPGVPVLLLATTCFLWSFFQLWRRAGRLPPEVPALREPRRSARKLNKWLPRLFPLGLVAPLSLAAFFLFFVRLRSVENRWYDGLITLLVLVSSFLMFSAWGQLLFAWRFFRRFLEALERHAMRDGFTNLPKELATLPLLNRGRQKPFLMMCARCCDTLTALKSNRTITRYVDFRVAYEKRAQTLRSHLSRLLNLVSKGPATEFYASRHIAAVKSEAERAILHTANALIERATAEFWQEGRSDSLDLQSDKRPQGGLNIDDKGRILAEEFIALRFSMYIVYVLDQMKKLMWFVVISFVLLVLALNVYPFQSPRLIEFYSIAIFIVLAVGTSLVLSQMDRDPMLSRLTDTEPNKIGKNFFLHAARFGALPLITVLSTEFPTIRSFLFSWIQPALQAITTSG